MIPGGRTLLFLRMVLMHNPSATLKITQKCIVLQEVEWLYKSFSPTNTETVPSCSETFGCSPFVSNRSVLSIEAEMRS